MNYKPISLSNKVYKLVSGLHCGVAVWHVCYNKQVLQHAAHAYCRSLPAFKD